MTDLPADVEAYSRSPEFNQDTLPAALRKQHSTSAGTWALIHVLEGRLTYRIYEPLCETVLEPGKPGVVQPEQLHEAAPASTPMRMYVEFYAARKS
ncbi:DUF1971 domain-containing protein [Methylobacterium isbiliense]|jgi:tellurite resistance-related uncharacterized protein|uniref:TehB/YeaR-like domain-containing protein n=1 Tax=Methylobacterium isbiliense TaxID=315478 RepID=A0ABQ4SS05_9HYPH|nr:DUF1971 domain-containing protein [Methylobacterium isbiliense]MDN3622631.1 DUF1971 domain-containing protein [Methylobacterium isbiliense]GJE04640.1 hypothetical protein GMJLKIPL_6604 [Methylobacterium isbiliense]